VDSGQRGVASAFLLFGSVFLCLSLGVLFFGAGEIAGAVLARNWSGHMGVVNMSLPVLALALPMLALAFVLIRRGTRILKSGQESRISDWPRNPGK